MTIASIWQQLNADIESGNFQQCIITPKDQADTVRITARLLALKGQEQVSFLYHHKTQDYTHNFAKEMALAELEKWFFGQAKNIVYRNQQEEIHLKWSKKDKVLVHRVPYQSSTQIEQHNREKTRYLDVTAPYLQALGITDKNAVVIPAMSRKWKQINKFIEIFLNAYESVGFDKNEILSVVDFGSGKAYLTFALKAFLSEQLQQKSQVVGVELRDNLVQFCQQQAQQFFPQGLHFFSGDIASYQPEKLDVMVALHACDVATDYALFTGIRLNSRIILSAPCCHKELRPQFSSPSLLKPILQHGIHLGQECEMLTDGLRALWLEACGYETKVFEFVSLEHTSKNKMILGIKRHAFDRKSARYQEKMAEISAIKNFYGIASLRLETLLQDYQAC